MTIVAVLVVSRLIMISCPRIKFQNVLLLIAAGLLGLVVYYSSRKYTRQSYHPVPMATPSVTPSKLPPLALLAKPPRVVIIGAGPTGLGVAHRLYELGILCTDTQVVILEQQDIPGGLAMSQRDENNFLWDMGGHIVFSHYKYFDRVLDNAVPEWNKRRRAAFAYMRGSSGKRKFIPYPVQESIHAMDEEEQQRCLEGLQEVVDLPITESPVNFDDWLLKNFGKGLCEVFMRKYNRKVWTVDPKEMNSVWVGERVAVIDIEEIKRKIELSKKNQMLQDSGWGPNKLFRFPRYGGTGGLWKAVSQQLPQGWFHFKHKVIGLDIEKKRLKVIVDNDRSYDLKYSILISTIPVDELVNMDKKTDPHMRALANELVYSHTHVIGIGLKGQPPRHLADKSWMYFPDDDSPFYRATVFSNYSDDHVPKAGEYWSLMCEVAEPKDSNGSSYWTKNNIIRKTVKALVKYGFISEDQVVSRYHHRLDHGYPVPSLKRDSILAIIQPWLESHSIYSRGRFGGWRYEVSNQDHSLMQGVEVADLIVRGIPEETYPNANLVNSMKSSNRSINSNILLPDYEIVIAHYNENLQWLLKFNLNQHIYVYHKGRPIVPDYRFHQWEVLPNVGRESHTYLHHIINNYDCLANVTVFLQGEISSHGSCYEDINDYIEEAYQNGYSAKAYKSLKEWGMLPHSGRWREQLEDGRLRASNFTLGEFWFIIFDNQHPEQIKWTASGCFGVTRERIHRRPVEHYKRLIGYVNDHPNPEEGHYFERLWFSMFDKAQ